MFPVSRTLRVVRGITRVQKVWRTPAGVRKVTRRLDHQLDQEVFEAKLAMALEGVDEMDGYRPPSARLIKYKRAPSGFGSLEQHRFPILDPDPMDICDDRVDDPMDIIDDPMQIDEPDPVGSETTGPSPTFRVDVLSPGPMDVDPAQADPSPVSWGVPSPSSSPSGRLPPLPPLDRSPAAPSVSLTLAAGGFAAPSVAPPAPPAPPAPIFPVAPVVPVAPVAPHPVVPASSAAPADAVQHTTSNQGPAQPNYQVKFKRPPPRPLFNPLSAAQASSASGAPRWSVPPTPSAHGQRSSQTTGTTGTELSSAVGPGLMGPPPVPSSTGGPVPRPSNAAAPQPFTLALSAESSDPSPFSVPPVPASPLQPPPPPPPPSPPLPPLDSSEGSSQGGGSGKKRMLDRS
ncbi:MAG: hypothetical protein M4579_005624 [Chaenotheca gracillima]|nr:MAG: hypothetical protein M4579_005624 [Chaenotheca gracillima]